MSEPSLTPTSGRRLDFLVMLYAFCIVTSELLGGKTVPLFSIGSFNLSVSVAILTLPIVFSINDAVAEVYGRARSRSLIKSGMLIVVCTLLFAALAVSLPFTERFAAMEPHFDLVFGLSIRMSIASLIAFGAAEFADLAVFFKIRAMLGTARLWLRNNVSNFISQFIDTAVFMLVAFWKFGDSVQGNLLHLLGMILPYWLLKCFMSVIETPLLYVVVPWLRKEGDRVRDRDGE